MAREPADLFASFVRAASRFEPSLLSVAEMSSTEVTQPVPILHGASGKTRGGSVRPENRIGNQRADNCGSFHKIGSRVTREVR
jgi:hypothetical protein